ncbi:hypothetical protein OG863_34370 [Streptomyces decoyicus]|uniref:NADH-ubiquinone oxidoreductase n=1 Tax=Streptomyces decoyicus TaxID=249567 RepID=A0ABZ1FRL8_9ACTN|nr:hypothetical protein [Streptomyces decoyicus]WSB72632.1 hypothetical protein OG863_34370 [Streptomyces decoyicus]
MGNSEERAEGAGPFTTRLTWRLEAGETAVWESRAARKRGTLAVRPAGATESSPRRAGAAALTRLRRLNGIAAGSFTFGGTLFVLGAALAQFSAMSATGTATIYFVGGVFFTLGGYASLVQAINAPRRESAAASLTTHRFRWWSYEPGRIDWLSTFVLFAGTLVFGINLLDSFLQGLTVQQMNRLVWAPDMVGCLLFLISGQLAVVEVCHGRLCLERRSLGWWIVALNQLGSVLFMVAALAAFTRPETGSPISVGIANWGTLTGALCFAVAGVLQAFEHP